MLFNSIDFIFFLLVVFAAYWGLNLWTTRSSALRLQNFLLIVSSYVFYGWWDWRFLTLIFASTLVDFLIGIQIGNANNSELPIEAPKNARSSKGKRWLLLSLAVNLGMLCYFKYANFFIEGWIDAWSGLGVEVHLSTLQIMLPVGISFYTFQTLSYSIDVYRRKIEPTRDLIAFGAFVSFFPQLVAGPIERASSLLPQISNRRQFEHKLASSGMKLILWGMFKKVVVADTCAIFVNDIFAGHSEYSSVTLLLGAVFFAFQIYGDFSGYSDIAIGVARLLGIKLMTNFKTPYFSRNIAEFWRRWHISLSTWFRDYIYIPLGGSRVGKWKGIRNTFVIFMLSGLWHGANWTFLVWGFIHAWLFLPLLLLDQNRKHLSDISGWPTIQEVTGMAFTFWTVTIAWVFFRAESVGQAVDYLTRIATFSNGIAPTSRMVASIGVIFITIVVDWVVSSYPVWLNAQSPVVKRSAYAMAAIGILLCWGDASTEFIYFQF